MAQKKQGNLKQLMVLTYDKDNYIDRMVQAYLDLVYETTGHVGKIDIQYETSLVIDCSNGSGALIIKKFIKKIENYLSVTLINDREEDVGIRLNHECGSEFVLRN